MASAEKRQRWRKRIRQPMEVAAQEMKDSVKSSEYTEGQAHKYMQKCTAESSTESESESSMEIVPRLLAGGLGKARDSKGLQFLDPYDGDSEDSSVPSDCSLNSLHGTEVAPWLNGALEATALEDDATSEDREPFPEPPDWFCPEARVSEIQAVSDCKAPLQLPSQEKNFPRALLQSSERTRATEAFTSLGLTPDRSLPVGIKPSSCCRSMTKRSLLKRKQETSISEGTSKEERNSLWLNLSYE